MVEKQFRGHLYEIDVIRAVTALSVVGVHAVAFTVVLTSTPLGAELQNAAVSALHFTREIFIAITGFVLVYSYANRPFSATAFWRKRGIGVLLPYVVWSLFYEWATRPPLPPLQWVGRTLADLLTGSASFQLYYILLTLEFYLVLPWFLRFIARTAHRPWRLLGASFAVQVALLAADYYLLQAGPFGATGLGQWLLLNHGRFLPLYQFYMVFGALAAVYMKPVRAFLLEHGRWMVAGLALGLALLGGNYVYQVNAAHQSMAYGISVFQPAMAVYGLAVSAFLYWVAYRWAVSRAPRSPRGHRFWLLLSNASFGIYLMHAYVLELVMDHIVPRMPALWPEPLRVALVWLLTAGATAAMCSLWLYIPGLSRLMGRPSALRRDAGLGRRLDLIEASFRRRLASAWPAAWMPWGETPARREAGAAGRPWPVADLQPAEKG